MTVIVNSEEIHPFLPSLGNPSVISTARAERRDIRPLEIAIINLMADNQATERQLALWLGNSIIQVKLTFAATDNYVQGIQNGRDSRNTPAEHILKFYKPWSEIEGEKFDGLVITGVNALKDHVSDEDIWPEVQQILDWSNTHALSSLFLCWGAQAALKHFYDVESYKATPKLVGLFEHRIVSDKTGLLFGFPDRFPVPVSRWKRHRREDILKHSEIEILADSDEAGPNLMAEPAQSAEEDHPYPRRVYILNHPEYDTETLREEYRRDSANNPATPLPRNYFPQNDATQTPCNSWRHTAYIYTNWIRSVYEATPFDRRTI